MAALVLASDVITRILERSNFENAVPGFTSTAEQYRVVNALYRHLYNKLVDARGAEYYALKQDFDLTPDVGVYPLADAVLSGGCGMPRFFELLSIHLRSDSILRRMKQWEYHELDALMRLDLYGSRHWSTVRYRVTDANLELLPRPAGTFHVYLRYVPTALELVASSPTATQSTTLDGVNGFEDWMVVMGAIQLRSKAQLETGDLAAELKLIDDEIEWLKSKRNAADAPRIVSRGNAWSLDNFPLPFGFADTDDHGF